MAANLHLRQPFKYIKSWASNTSVDFARKAGDNLVNVGKQVVGKASDVVTTVYADTKGLASKPFEVLSNPFTMVAVGIVGIAGIMILTKV